MGYPIQQSTANQDLLFQMIDSTDHITGKTGLTITVTLSKNGASFASPSGAVSEIGNGFYKVAKNATDSNTLGPLALHATATGADPCDDVFMIVAYNPQDATALGLSRIDAAITSRLASGNVTVGTNLDKTGYTASTVSDKTGYTVSTVSDKTGYSLSSGGIQAIWDAATSGFTTAGSVGKLLVDNLNSAVGGVAAAVWAVATRTLSAFSFTPNVGGYASGQDPATLVLDATASSHNTGGSIGAAINGAGSAGDPWTTSLPGTYGAGTAGKIVGDNLNAPVGGVAASVWAVATSGLTSAGTIGKLLVDNLNAQVSGVAAAVWAVASRTLSAFGFTPNVGGYESGQDPATLVLDATASAHDTAGSIGAALQSAGGGGGATVDDIWDALLTDHTGAGSMGQALGAAGGAADPLLNDVPGTYAAGTAGYSLGHLVAPDNSTISDIDSRVQALQGLFGSGTTIPAPVIVYTPSGPLTPAALIQEARDRLSHPSTTLLTEQKMTSAFNAAQERWAMDTECLERIVAWDTIAGQQEYDRGTYFPDLYRLDHVTILDAGGAQERTLDPVPWGSGLPENYRQLNSGSPYAYAFRGEEAIVIYPAPSQSTTNGLTLYGVWLPSPISDAASVDPLPFPRTHREGLVRAICLLAIELNLEDATLAARLPLARESYDAERHRISRLVNRPEQRAPVIGRNSVGGNGRGPAPYDRTTGDRYTNWRR